MDIKWITHWMDNIFSVIHQIHLGYIPKRNECICLPKNMYKSIHCTLFTIARNQSDVHMCRNSDQGSSTNCDVTEFPWANRGTLLFSKSDCHDQFMTYTLSSPAPLFHQCSCLSNPAHINPDCCLFPTSTQVAEEKHIIILWLVPSASQWEWLGSLEGPWKFCGEHFWSSQSMT